MTETSSLQKHHHDELKVLARRHGFKTRERASTEVWPAVVTVRLVRGDLSSFLWPVGFIGLMMLFCFVDSLIFIAMLCGAAAIGSLLLASLAFDPPVTLLVYDDGFTLCRRLMTTIPRVEEHTWEVLRGVEVRHISPQWKESMTQHDEEMRKLRVMIDSSSKEHDPQADKARARLAWLEGQLRMLLEQTRAQTPPLSQDALRAMSADDSARFDVVIRLEHATEELEEATWAQAVVIVEALEPMIHVQQRSAPPKPPELSEW